jgi:hypothetical protein
VLAGSPPTEIDLGDSGDSLAALVGSGYLPSGHPKTAVHGHL